MRYWWVNQNQTYEEEVRGGFLWSPKTTKDGRRNQFYENMESVSPGDLILSFADTYIQAVGVAQGTAQTASKPDFGSKGNYWLHEGWLVPVEFVELKQKLDQKILLMKYDLIFQKNILLFSNLVTVIRAFISLLSVIIWRNYSYQRAISFQH